MLTRVVSRELTKFERAGTANDVLSQVLGVDYTMPEWAASELQRSVERAAARGLTESALDDLERELHEADLEQYVPTALIEASKLSRRAGESSELREAEYDELAAYRDDDGFFAE